MANLLTTGMGSGTQVNTQSPQAPTAGSDTAAAKAGAVQPGTATSLLSSDKQGIALKNQQLSTVNLGTRQPEVSQFTPPAVHHTNPVLYGFSGLLLVVALAMIWATVSSAKNTT